MKYDPTLVAPDEMVQIAMKLKDWMLKNNCTSLCGMGAVNMLARDNAELKRERDMYRSMAANNNQQGKFS